MTSVQEPPRRRGRPHTGKIKISMRMDPLVIERFKKAGPGWQERVNDVLVALVTQEPVKVDGGWTGRVRNHRDELVEVFVPEG